MVIEVASPAKLNLFLAVRPRDSSGYHPIRTEFQAIGLMDEVRIDLDATSTSVEFLDAEIPPNNTVTKSLRLIAEFCDLPPLGIQIRKVIPSEAGLGGGSSNAAAIIRAVRHLMPEYFSAEDAMSVARAVGADVPFFLVGGRARGEGYGEQLTPLPDSESTFALVLKPQYGHSTADMYRALDELQFPFAEFPGKVGYNDFERVACETTDLAERLQVFGAKVAAMTGSGSAVYGLFDRESEAIEAKRQSDAENLGQSWVVPFLTRAESLQVRSTEYGPMLRISYS
jgi:4-diphosphocytidyl-2-C-methyl-D-erythritol kinase